MLTSMKSSENDETDQEHCILSRKVCLMAVGQRYHGEPSPTSDHYQRALIPKLLEIDKEIVREVVRGDKNNLRKSANRDAQISVIHAIHCTDLCFAICRFSPVVFVTSSNFTHNLLFF